MTDTQLRKAIHMKMLAKSESAKVLGEMTAVPLGFAVDIAMALFQESQRQLLREVLEGLPDQKKGTEKLPLNDIERGYNIAIQDTVGYIEQKIKELE